MNNKKKDTDQYNNNLKERYIEMLYAGKYQKKWFEDYKKLRTNAKIEQNVIKMELQKVETVNKPRIKGGEHLPLFPEEEWPDNYLKDWKNMLIWGDNKHAINALLKKYAGKIKLIYIDPPFFVGADFKVKTKIGNGEATKEPSIIEKKAYSDTWHGGIASYLKFMRERLLLMKELLAEDGSIYVHLDHHVVHYVKILMDEIFGYDNFQREIIWDISVLSGYKTKTDNWIRGHDTILFYSKNKKKIFNKLSVPHRKEYLDRFNKTDEKGRKYFDGRGKRRYLNDAIKNGKAIGDVWGDIMSFQQTPTSKERLNYDTQKPELLLERIILTSSNEGDIIADFHIGSGTTLAVAEKLGRRWIGCDLSKYAIHTTRKRMMDIQNSKDLLNKKNLYEKRSRPFEIYNIGNYEMEQFINNETEYLNFVLNVYGATRVSGFKYIHGKRDNRMVRVGNIETPITMSEIEETVMECVQNNITKIDVLGWEWAFEVNELAKTNAKKHKIDLKLIQIPLPNEIKSTLNGNMKLLKFPDHVLDEKTRSEIKFHEPNYVETDVNIKDKKVTISITNLQVPLSNWTEEIKDKISSNFDYIDYWSIDWDYQGDTFHNQWQTYRTKKDPNIDKKATHTYRTSGKKKIMIKVVDIFGNDANKIEEVNIE